MTDFIDNIITIITTTTATIITTTTTIIITSTITIVTILDIIIVIIVVVIRVVLLSDKSVDGEGVVGEGGRRREGRVGGVVERDFDGRLGSLEKKVVNGDGIEKRGERGDDHFDQRLETKVDGFLRGRRKDKVFVER